MRIHIPVVVTLAVTGCTSIIDITVDAFDSTVGCMEGRMAQFGQYIGKWNIGLSGTVTQFSIY